MISGKNLGFPNSSVGKESDCNSGDPGLIPGLRRSTGEGNGYPLQYSGLETSMDYTVPGVAKSWIRVTYFYFHKKENKFSLKKQNLQKVK